jgi:hypothetical protein
MPRLSLPVELSEQIVGYAFVLEALLVVRGATWWETMAGHWSWLLTDDNCLYSSFDKLAAPPNPNIAQGRSSSSLPIRL